MEEGKWVWEGEEDRISGVGKKKEMEKGRF